MKLFRIAVLASLLMVLFAVPSFAASFEVGPSGDFTNLSDAFNTIGAYAGTHDIYVKAGAYTDANLVVPNNIDNLIGEDGVVFTGTATDYFLDVSGVINGFTMTDFKIVGYDRAIDGPNTVGATFERLTFEGNAQGIGLNDNPGATGNTIQDCLFLNNTSYGVVLGVNTTGNTVQDNCFVGNGSPAGYDSSPGGNTWTNNYFDDAVAATYYDLAGGSNQDTDPSALDNSVVLPGTGHYSLGEQFTVDIMWTIPACMDPLDSTALAFYEFTVNYNSSKLSVVNYGYDDTFFGDSAVYPGITTSPGHITFTAADFVEPHYGDGRIGTITFEVDKVLTSNTFTITSVYTDENGDTLVVQNTPATAVLDDTVDPVLVSFEALDTIGDMTFSDNYPLYVQIKATDDWDLDKIEYSWNNTTWNTGWGLSGLSGTLYETAPDSLPINIGSMPDGDTVIYVRAVDDAGHTSNVAELHWTVDKTGPVLDSIVVVDADGCAEAGYTSDTAVVINMYTADTDVFEMEFSHGSGWQPALLYANPADFYLPNTDGPYTVYAKLTDKYGNTGGTKTYAMTLDQVDPPTTQDFAITTTSGTDKTKDTMVTIDVTTFSAWRYAASENAADLTCNGTAWMTPAHNDPFALSNSDGMKVVYFTTRDEAGNMSPVQEDTVYLDRVGPDLTAFSVADPAGFDCVGGGWTIDVHYAYDAAVTDVQWLGITVDGSCTDYINVSTYPNDTTISYTVPVGCQDGIRDYEFVGKLYDNVAPCCPGSSNMGASMTDSLYFDFSGVATAPAIKQYDYDSWSATWSNDKTVQTVFTGASADIVEVRMAEAMADLTNATWQPFADTMDFMWFDTSTVVENTYMKVWAEFRDCAGATSAPTQAGSGIIFDFTDPVIDSVKINAGAALASDTNVTVTLYVTETYKGAVDLSEDNTFATATHFASFGTGTYAFVLSSGDGNKTVYARMYDAIGNGPSATASATIKLDMTDPSGTFDLVSSNLSAMPGWTNTNACKIVWGAYDGDVWRVRMKTDAPAAPWVYMYAPLTDTAFTIYNLYGMRYVTVQFQDSAYNWGPLFQDSIVYSGTVPGAPAVATGTPGGSLMLKWSKVADAQSYILRYNYSGDYPEYNVTNPPAPNFTQGWYEAEVTDTFYNFDGPHMDNFHFSIWTRHNNGNVSTAYNTDVLENNYVLGDFYDKEADTMTADGCISFGQELGALAASFRQADGDAFFDPYVDVAPTNDGTASGYAMPDDSINAADVFIIAYNYNNFMCTGLKRFDVPKPAAPGPVAVTAVYPERVTAGETYTVTYSTDNPQAIFAYHTVIDFNSNVAELVSVTPGSAYEGVEQSFFMYDTKSGHLDLTSARLSNEEFSGDELFVITFTARSDAAFDLDGVLMDFRDANLGEIDVEFNATKVVELPTSYSLSQNYPNPFNPTTTIEFALPVAGQYNLTIYNITGQVVESFDGSADAGVVSIVWDASRYSSGVYFYKLDAGTFSATRKMVLIK